MKYYAIIITNLYNKRTEHLVQTKCCQGWFSQKEKDRFLNVLDCLLYENYAIMFEEDARRYGDDSNDFDDEIRGFLQVSELYKEMMVAADKLYAGEISDYTTPFERVPARLNLITLVSIEIK